MTYTDRLRCRARRCPVAGQYQNGLATGCQGTLHIAQGITDEGRPGCYHAQSRLKLVDQSGLGLATFALVIRMMRAETDALDVSASGADRRKHFVVDACQRWAIE